MKEIARLRELPGATILEAINCAYIARRFFNRTRAWFMQRMNNSRVNGKPVTFSPDDLRKLRISLNTLASEITDFAKQIPDDTMNMKKKVYVVTEPVLIEFLIDSDLDGFKAYLYESKENEDFIMMGEPESFDTEAEALAFCEGIGYGADERAIPVRYPLRSFEPADRPFIELIENY